MAYERFAVVRVPFPFTDRAAAKNRPALVISDPQAFDMQAGYSLLAMITSMDNAPWPLDCPLTDLVSAGLPAPSKVRCKLFTLDHRLIRGELGRLAAVDRERVDHALRRLLGFAVECARAADDHDPGREAIRAARSRLKQTQFDHGEVDRIKREGRA